MKRLDPGRGWNRAISNGAGVGVAPRDADDNRLVQNTICENDAEQIVIDEESTGNRLLKNETECK